MLQGWRHSVIPRAPYELGLIVALVNELIDWWGMRFIQSDARANPNLSIIGEVCWDDFVCASHHVADRGRLSSALCPSRLCQFSDCKDPLIVGHAFLAWHWQDILPCTMRCWLHCMIMIQHRLCLFDSSRWPELSEKKQGPNLAKSSIIILVQYRPMEVASPGAITNFR